MTSNDSYSVIEVTTPRTQNGNKKRSSKVAENEWALNTKNGTTKNYLIGASIDAKEGKNHSYELDITVSIAQNGSSEFAVTATKGPAGVTGNFVTGGGAFMFTVRYAISETYDNGIRTEVIVSPGNGMNQQTYSFDMFDTVKVSVGDYNLIDHN